jgi:hypothetical protein
MQPLERQQVIYTPMLLARYKACYLQIAKLRAREKFPN